jgi:hypothetical protein
MQKLRVLLYLLSAAALCGSIGWFMMKPDWEPGVGIFTSLAGLLGLFLSDRSPAAAEERNTGLLSDSVSGQNRNQQHLSRQGIEPTAPSVPPEVTTRSSQPLMVRFADGVRCKVDMSASYQILRENAPMLVAMFGSPAQAETYLKNQVKSVALAVLERCTSDEARRSRASLQNTIRESVRSQIAEAGLLLHSVTLEEITQIG